jgi:hypothetical protein
MAVVWGAAGEFNQVAKKAMGGVVCVVGCGTDSKKNQVGAMAEVCAFADDSKTEPMVSCER